MNSVPISAAKARAKLVYERLINFINDQGTIDALQFLMIREITHMKAFSAAVESMDKPAFSSGVIPPFSESSTSIATTLPLAIKANLIPAAHGTKAAIGKWWTRQPFNCRRPTNRCPNHRPI